MNPLSDTSDLEISTDEHRGPSRVLVIGDSICLGAAEVLGRDVVGHVRPSCIELLRERLPDCELILDAQVHRTSSHVRDEIGQLLSAHQPDVVLMTVCGNDADVNWRRFIMTDGRAAQSCVPISRFIENMRAIILTVRATGAGLILTDMPNHDLSVRGPYLSRLSSRDVGAMIDRRGGQEESDRGLSEYRLALSKLAGETGSNLVCYGDVLASHPPREVIGDDGVHPSAAGHAIIAQALLPVVAAACRQRARRSLQKARA